MDRLILSWEKELDNHQLLKNINNLINDKYIVKNFSKSPRYYDEPKLYQYSVQIADTRYKSDADRAAGYSGGASFDESKAIIKAVCEAVERYCLAIYKEKDLIRASYSKIKNRSIPLKNIISFSATQLKAKSLSSCKYTDKTNFFWANGKSIFDNKPVLIPAQLIFVPYNFKKEKIIRLPISTGAASGTSFTGALLRGILEIIERDAFMIHYLSNVCGELIDFSDNDRLLSIKNYFKKYRLDLYLINLPTDLKIYTFLTLIIDKTGVGPAVSAGLKAGLDSLETAIGSIEEGWHSRPWIRDELNKKPDLNKIISEGKTLHDIKKRGLFWSSIEMIKYVDPWINNKRVIRFNKLRSLSKGKLISDLHYILSLLRSKGHNVYYVDITRPEVEKYRFKVLKAVIPSLHPLYLDEPYPYLGGNRIYQLPVGLGYKENALTESELNRTPHFFL